MLTKNPSFLVYFAAMVVPCLNVLALWGYRGAVRNRSETTPNHEDLKAPAGGAALAAVDPPAVARVLRARRNAAADNILPFAVLGLLFVLWGATPMLTGFLVHTARSRGPLRQRLTTPALLSASLRQAALTQSSVVRGVSEMPSNSATKRSPRSPLGTVMSPSRRWRMRPGATTLTAPFLALPATGRRPWEEPEFGHRVSQHGPIGMP